MNNDYDENNWMAAFFSLLVVAIMISFLLWSAAWQSGYNQGQSVAHAYFAATNSTPSKAWALDHSHWHFTHVDQILESLKDSPNGDW